MATQAKPWDKPNPRQKAGKPSKHLSPDEKASAKASAKRAGRKSPSLVDNMAAAAKKTGKKAATKQSAKKKSTTKKSTTKKSTKKTATKKAIKKPASKKAASKRQGASTPSAGRARLKDPHGGLTEAGRKAFAKSQGANLKPGVMTTGAEMTPDDMKRKGSWAVRFYGRDLLPPLVDKNGKPTRLALTAHAWGEPVPKTEAAARKIAAKGRKLLDRYKKLGEN